MCCKTGKNKGLHDWLKYSNWECFTLSQFITFLLVEWHGYDGIKSFYTTLFFLHYDHMIDYNRIVHTSFINFNYFLKKYFLTWLWLTKITDFFHT